MQVMETVVTVFMAALQIKDFISRLKEKRLKKLLLEKSKVIQI